MYRRSLTRPIGRSSRARWRASSRWCASRDRPSLQRAGDHGLTLGHSQQDLPAARAVEFAEEDGLPPAERRYCALDEHDGRGTDQRGLDMAVGVSRGMSVASFVGDQVGEPRKKVLGHIRIGALVDDHARRRVGNVDVAYAVGYPAIGNGFCHIFIELDELVALARFDGNLPYIRHIGLTS